MTPARTVREQNPSRPFLRGRAPAGGWPAILVWLLLAGCAGLSPVQQAATEPARSGNTGAAPTTVASPPAGPVPAATIAPSTTGPTTTRTAPPTITETAARPAGTTARTAVETTTSSIPIAATTQPITTETTTGTTATTTTPAGPVEPATPEIMVLAAFPHDPRAFTQGLVVHDGVFYESTGLYGESTVRIVDPATGEVLSSVALDERYFGEGLAVVGGRIVQLTWQEEIAFIWDAESLAPLGTFTYEGEGWGLCAFEDRFVMSNGSSTLTFRDLEDFEVIGAVNVTLADEPVERINELECVGELVYANVWLTDQILVISPLTGQVVARVDGASLRERLSYVDGIDVLNGIAYHPDRRTFFLTGKFWPEIFEVRIGEDR